MLKRLLSTLAVLGLIGATPVLAQTGTLTGTVTDSETGDPVPGANVSFVDLNRGAATDVDGNYTIGNVPVGTHTLRASFVGYQTYTTDVTIEANQAVTQDIELNSGAVGLEEVVVTGYGQRKTAGEVTGSVSNISNEDIEDVPAQNVESLLQGRASGVTLSATSGNPGAGFEVDIRGRGSINAGSRPLYIVDGVQVSFEQGSEVTDRSPLNALSPGDIESIQVLKDAAASAIYGSQASNGVVLIETKSGRQGDVEVSLNFEGGVRFQSRRFDLANRDQWAEINQEAFEDYPSYGFRENILPAFGYDSDTPVEELRDFRWQDWLFDPGGHMKVGFSANGGDEDTQFFLSGNITQTGGALKTKAVNYDNKSIRVNMTQQLTEDLNVELNLGLNNEEDAGVCQDGFFINCPFYQAIGEEPPISYPYNDDGSYNPNTEQAAVYNPALFLNEETRTVNTTQLLGNITPTYQLTPWLSAEAQFGIDWQDAEEYDYSTPELARSEGGVLSRRFNDVTNLTFNGTLNADYTFGDSHNVSGLLGTEYRREYEEEEETGFQGFNNSLLRVPAAASEVGFFQGFNTEYRVLSYFGRANYNYDGRYIATVTMRYDGTSRFGSDQRFGLFPSGSIGWRLSEENFFNVDTVDDLKFRVSYGVTGNSDIGNFSARGLYGIGGSYRDQVGIRPFQLANPRLSWEEKRELNVGVDWSLWSGRLTGSLNLYRSVNDELLLDRPLPTSSGFGSITENAGKVQNQGIEFDLSTVNIQTEDFRWSTRFNVSVTQNEVLDLVGDLEELNGGEVLPIAEGHAIEAWKVPIWAGVNPADGRPMWYDKDGNLTYRPTQEDRKFVNGAEEDVVGGAGTRFSYKGLSLDLFFDFSFGAQSLPFTQTTFTDPFGENVLEFVVEERWEEPGDVARYPRPAPFGIYDLLPNSEGADNPDQTSTNWLYKNNYIRLKNARISYQMPESVMNKVGLQGARIYVSGINLLQWTPYLGIDPEVAEEDEESSYPAEQQINIGLQLDL